MSGSLAKKAKIRLACLAIGYSERIRALLSVSLAGAGISNAY